MRKINYFQGSIWKGVLGSKSPGFITYFN
uniref:Uncharacterized protein n=1 Tax=Arundo donax TaxID=35708 RepID=A0A0A9AUZ4_ARUDO